jgi:hypothetical protein
MAGFILQARSDGRQVRCRFRPAKKHARPDMMQEGPEHGKGSAQTCAPPSVCSGLHQKDCIKRLSLSRSAIGEALEATTSFSLSCSREPRGAGLALNLGCRRGIPNTLLLAAVRTILG